MVLTRPAAPLAERVLEVRVAASHLLHTGKCGGRKRRATEVRVDEDPRRVQHAAQVRRT
jgi:hypothetical protein